MAKKHDYVHQITRILKLVVLVAAVAALIPTMFTYFAKAKTVGKLDHRLGLSISQDEIDRAKADIRWMKQQTAFERRNQPPTVAETEIIKEAECDLEDAHERHKHRVKVYEEKYKKIL